jgi:hypothetical protein
MPVAQLNKPGCHPISTSQAQNYRDLLMQVNIGSNDRRTSMSNYPEVFSPAMQANLERASGQVVCDIGDYEYTAEARIIEDGRQIITNGHVFSQKNMPIAERLPHCTFATKANPSKKIDLDLREGFYHFFSKNPRKDKLNDVALVRLKESVGDVEIPKVSTPPIEGETVYMVSHNSEGASHPVDSRQLVAQDCTAMYIKRNTDNAFGYFANDCSSLPADSAATYYAVRNGETVIVGFEVSGGFPSANGRPYDVNHPDSKLRSFSLGLTYDERLLSESRALAKRANEMANRNVDRKVNSAPGKG